MKVIYANILWFSALLIGLVGDALNRHSDSVWKSMPDVRNNYDLVYGLLGLYVGVSIVGLLSKKKWGYSFALSANVTLAIIPISILIVSIVMLEPDASFMNVMEINLTNIVVGLVSFGFWVYLVKSNIRQSYV